MKCTSCNSENPEGAVFCIRCGARLPEEEKKADAAENNVGSTENETADAAGKIPNAVPPCDPPKTSGGGKKLVLGVAAAICVAAVVLIAVIIALVSGGKTGFVTCDGYFMQYATPDDETVVTFNGKPLPSRIDGKIAAAVTSLDSTAALLTVSENSAYTAYAATKDTLRMLSEDVAYSGLSADGSHAYCVTTDGELSLYTVKDGKKTKIDDDVISNYSAVAISPGGSVLLYCTTDEDESDDFTLHAWKNGKSVDVAKNYAGLAATDDGKLLYIMNEERSVYVTKFGSDDRTKLCSDVDSYSLNSTGTEIVMISDGKTYISIKGGEKAKINNSSVLVLASPLKTDSARPISHSIDYLPVESYVGAPVLYAKSAGDDVSLGFIKKNGGDYEIVRVANNVTGVLTADCKTYYFLKNNDLCRVELKEDAEIEKLEEDVSSYSLTASGKSVYAIDEDDALIKITGKNKTKVADDIESPLDYAVMGEGVLYLVDTSSSTGEGTLFYSSNGKNKKVVTDEAVSIIASAHFGLGWYMTSDEDVYFTTNGTKFTRYDPAGLKD